MVGATSPISSTNIVPVPPSVRPAADFTVRAVSLHPEAPVPIEHPQIA